MIFNIGEYFMSDNKAQTFVLRNLFAKKQMKNIVLSAAAAV